MVGCGLLNAAIERVAYRPLRRAPRLVPLITAIGVSFILQDVGLIWKGSQPVSLPPETLPHGTIFTLGTCPECVTYKLGSVLRARRHGARSARARLARPLHAPGKAMRAAAQDKDAAAMMGIDVNRTISFTFLIAGCARRRGRGRLRVLLDDDPLRHGLHLGLIAFTAAVLGGIGNLPGAVLGALLIGFIQAFNEGLSWHAPGRLDAVDRLRDPDPDPRLPAPGPARRADAGRRVGERRLNIRKRVQQASGAASKPSASDARAGAAEAAPAARAARGAAARDRRRRDRRRLGTRGPAAPGVAGAARDHVRPLPAAAAYPAVSPCR